MNSAFWRDQIRGLGILVLRTFFATATCSAFQLELEILEKKERLHALRVEKHNHRTEHIGTAGYVDDFACHLLGAGVCELEHGEHQQ